MSRFTPCTCQLGSPVAPHRAREAAVALNNTAISLLSRQKYHEAMETFKNSVAVMRFSFPTPPRLDDDSDSVLSRPSDDKINETLHKAARSLASSSLLSKDVNCISELPDDLSAESVLSLAELVRCRRLSKCVHAIRIHTCSNELIESNLDIDSALILLNYGVACRLHFQVCNRQDIMSTTSSLFHLAHKILSNVNLEELEEFNMLRFFLVSTLVLENLILTCDVLKDVEQGQIYHHQLHLLSYELFELVYHQQARALDFFDRAAASAA